MFEITYFQYGFAGLSSFPSLLNTPCSFWPAVSIVIEWPPSQLAPYFCSDVSTTTSNFPGFETLKSQSTHSSLFTHLSATPRLSKRSPAFPDLCTFDRKAGNVTLPAGCWRSAVSASTLPVVSRTITESFLSGADAGKLIKIE